MTANHQVKNAQALVKQGAAAMILEDKLDSRTLLVQVDKIMNNPEVREKMAKASKKIGRPNAADLLINVLKKAEQDHQ